MSSADETRLVGLLLAGTMPVLTGPTRAPLRRVIGNRQRPGPTGPISSLVRVHGTRWPDESARHRPPGAFPSSLHQAGTRAPCPQPLLGDVLDEGRNVLRATSAGLAIAADHGHGAEPAVSATGAVFAGRHCSGDSALSDPGAKWQYGIILGAEFGVAAAGTIMAVRAEPGRGDHRARSMIDRGGLS